MDQQLKLDDKVVDVVDRTKRKICVPLLRYNMHKPRSAYAQVGLFARKKTEENFQQILDSKYKLEENINLLEVMISVHNKDFTYKPICNVQ